MTLHNMFAHTVKIFFIFTPTPESGNLFDYLIKIWFAFKVHGIQKYSDLIRQNLRQTQYLTELITGNKQLEIMAPTSMNILCFRYVKEGLNNNQLNKINRKIVMDLHDHGVAISSYTVINGCYVIRASITNHRSRIVDFNELIEKVIELG